MKVDAVESPPLRSKTYGTWDWRLRAIRWGAVFEYQNWGFIPLLIPAVIILILAHFDFQKHPRYRDAYLYDASIGYPDTGNTISNGTVSLFPWLALLISVLVVEFGLYYQYQSITSAAAASLHMILSCLVNFIIVLAVSEVTKAVTGSLRPNFLAKCQPDPAQLADPFQFQQPVRCTNPNEYEVNQARLSFVSGHASNTLSTSWFCTFYLVWSLYWRDGAPYAYHVFGGRGSNRLRRVLFELLYAFFYYWLLFVLLLSWFSSCTRIWDNQHSEADVLGGLMIALLLTTPYVLKSIGQYAVFKRELDIYHETTPEGVQRLAAMHQAERDGRTVSVIPHDAPHLGSRNARAVSQVPQANQPMAPSLTAYNGGAHVAPATGTANGRMVSSNGPAGVVGPANV